MKRLLAIVVLGVACALPVWAQSAAEKEIRAVEKAWDAINRKWDGAKLQRILAEEYTAVDGDLKTYVRAECLQPPKETLSKVLSWTFDVQSVRVYGESAIVTGVWKTSTIRGGRKTEGSVRFVDLFVKRDGRWQAVYSQNTKTPAK